MASEEDAHAHDHDHAHDDGPPGDIDPEPGADIIRMLIATDIHLGYNEKDPVRGNDSFVTFEEILAYAKKYHVDLVLLGGDLFHENKPTRTCMHRTMELMREYCFGDRPVRIQIVSDQALAFHSKFKRVNYEDPNFNIEVPIFAIHGNHDDPAGEGGLAALDILSAANLVNYFGKAENVDDISIHPILLTKGSTKLALYGLGAIRDERLHRTFADKKVRFMRPVEARDEWFNLFVFHQNRLSHSPKNFIPAAFLPDFLHLVVWGHEHECLLPPTEAAQNEVLISQPGSSVATSLHESEVGKKFVGLLEIRGTEFRLSPLGLKTVRPFVTGDAVLSEEPELHSKEPEAVAELLAAKVDALIEQARKEWPREHPRAPDLPLVRLRVDHSGGFEKLNGPRFGQRFVGKVANPADILLFHKRKAERAAPKPAPPKPGAAPRAAAPREERVSVEQLIREELAKSSAVPDILLESEFGTALHSFVEKDEKSAIGDFVNKVLDQTQKFLRDEDPSRLHSAEDIAKLVTARTANLRLDESQQSAEAGDLPVARGGDSDEERDDDTAMAPPKKPSGKAKPISLLDDDGPAPAVDEDASEPSMVRKRASAGSSSGGSGMLQFMVPSAAKRPKPAAAAAAVGAVAKGGAEEKKRKSDEPAARVKVLDTPPAPPAAKAKLTAPSLSLWGGTKKR